MSPRAGGNSSKEKKWAEFVNAIADATMLRGRGAGVGAVAPSTETRVLLHGLH